MPLAETSFARPTSINMADTFPSSTVFLNVYDIVPHNDFLSPYGIGVHHTAVEVYGYEIAFGRCREGSGVFECEPKHCPAHIFREQLVLGNTPYRQAAVEEWLMWLRRESANLGQPPPLNQEAPLDEGPQDERGYHHLASGAESTATPQCPTEALHSSGWLVVADGTYQPTRWNGSRYHLLRNNCNHFAEYCARALLPAQYLAKPYASPKSLVYDTGEFEWRRMTCGGAEQQYPPLAGGGEAPPSSASAGASMMVEGPDWVLVRKLVPRWTNRIASLACAVLPTRIAEALEEADRNAQGI